jgi:small subunit ribosomal protein S5
VPDSIRKAADRARRNIKRVAITETGTIPYEVRSRYAGANIFLKPASPGTGNIAGGAVRAVLEAAGVNNILSKSQGSNNMLNVAMATFEALKDLKTPQEIAAMRGKEVEDVLPFWEKAALYQQRATMERVKEKQQAEREADAEMTAGEAAAAKKEGD